MTEIVLYLFFPSLPYPWIGGNIETGFVKNQFGYGSSCCVVHKGYLRRHLRYKYTRMINDER